MHLNRQARIQMAIFTVIALAALALMTVNYMKLPSKWFGIGHYTVMVDLPRAAGLYETSNVTYRGTEVGRVTSVHLTGTGVVAEMSLKSGIDIPSDLQAQVHSQSAIGEQYIELLPRSATARPLRNGDVIAAKDTTVPVDINAVIDSVKTGLQAIPHDNLKTVVDESYTAVGGLGPELSQIVKAGTDLSIDARQNLDPMLALIDKAKPVLDSQNKSADAIAAWASNLATVTQELKNHDQAVSSVIKNGAPALDEARQLVQRLQPTLPLLLANLDSVAQVGLTYRNDIEQILVFLPQLVAVEQGAVVANVNSKQPYKGAYLSFNLNLNLPPPCTTGYLPAQQVRSPSLVDYPDRPAGNLYCRIPQDSQFNVRGVRNIPCETRPGKRAATVKECESDENYVPLNDGMNWKGDPNATFSGQDVPQLPPGTPPQGSAAPPPIAAVLYNPATGAYTGPDGRHGIQSDLAQNAQKEKTWQSMLLPPGN
ncbi:mammalian cell entry protein [Mycolicibacterium mucogenicum]|uniref:Mammalian cell entry protein n=1 Tax=Mycolicibacterium mucogenicum TaxID=56689 RepID=A0A1A3HCV5_MYCMU|nr:MlaD family protein [Mycolicibacterium mucogenicum]OBJ45448.1 mammalian cell entry protein [Mycolicibacterium mucogenicum]